jgi:hypothetical protein
MAKLTRERHAFSYRHLSFPERYEFPAAVRSPGVLDVDEDDPIAKDSKKVARRLAEAIRVIDVPERS